jgi:integrase
MAKGFAAIPGAGVVGYNRALAALSVFFTYAIAKKFIEENPMESVKYLREPEAKRGRMTADEIDELLHTAISGGDDPLLDHTFLWTLLETAARVGGLLNLQLQDINMKNQTIMLYEKGGKYREQPVTEELANTLVELATSRGAIAPTDSVFRYRIGAKFSGCPMTSRRIDTIWKRLRNELPWVEERRVSSHVIRHTTLTFVDRFVSPTVARKYAGHGRRNVTETYTQADGDEVAGALEVVFGRPHPLA